MINCTYWRDLPCMSESLSECVRRSAQVGWKEKEKGWSDRGMLEGRRKKMAIDCLIVLHSLLTDSDECSVED